MFSVVTKKIDNSASAKWPFLPRLFFSKSFNETCIYLAQRREWITSMSTESSMSLSPAVSPSFCSLKISSGLLYGLRASRCVTLCLSGLSSTSLTLFLFEALAPFFTLDKPTPFLMLLRRGAGDCRGLVRLASAGAGARTVTFLPASEWEI